MINDLQLPISSFPIQSSPKQYQLDLKLKDKNVGKLIFEVWIEIDINKCIKYFQQRLYVLNDREKECSAISNSFESNSDSDSDSDSSES